MKKQPVETLTKPQHKAVAAVPSTPKSPVRDDRRTAPLDKHGKPMTRMCPWCSYPMKAFMEGWLRCDHCNATDPVTPDKEQPKMAPRKLKTPSDRGYKYEPK